MAYFKVKSSFIGVTNIWELTDSGISEKHNKRRIKIFLNDLKVKINNNFH